MKSITYGPRARRAAIEALEAAVRLVAPTLGPLPRTVLVERRFKSPQLVASAVEALDALEVADRARNSVLAMLRDAAHRVRADGGGVATWLVLTHALVRGAVKAIDAGRDPFAAAREIHEAERRVQRALARAAVKLGSRAEIAAVGRSAAPDAAGVIDGIADDLGRGAAVVVEDSKQAETTVSRVEGLQFARGWASAHFINKPETDEVVMERPLVLLYEPKVASPQELAPFLERVAAKSKSLLMIVGGIDPEPIATLVVNRLRGVLHACAVVAPAAERPREELLVDLAAATGAAPILSASPAPLRDATTEPLGRARRVVIDREKTTLTLEPDPPGLRAHLKGLRRRLESGDLPLVERDDLQERIARLSGRLVQIFVGGATETEVALRKADLQAAVRAVRGAIAEGVVPGGGAALRDAAAEEGFREALTAPMARICLNAGISSRRIAELGPGEILDARTGRATKAADAGILDPLPTVAVSLKAAASMAAVLLTTEAIVAEAAGAPEPYVPPGIERAWEASRSMKR